VREKPKWRFSLKYNYDKSGFTNKTALAKLLTEMVWPHFWAEEIILLLLVLVYCTVRELARVIGREKMLRLFFGPAPLPAF